MYTNLANGNTVTSVETSVFNDLQVTENDGILTVLFLATGNAVVYGPDGKAIARNPGQIRDEFVVDLNDPDDPDDDILLSETRVKESTGRTDDFCEAVVPVLLG